MFRELPQSKKAGTAHHLITVRKTPTHCLQHRWQQPNKERDQKVNILKSWWLLLVSQLTHNKSMGPQWKMNCLKKQKKEYMWNFFFSMSVNILGAYVVSTSFSQHCKTHETPLPLIGVFTGKACLSERHLKQTHRNTLSKRQVPKSELFKWSMKF